jgi:hypothetical protein
MILTINSDYFPAQDYAIDFKGLVMWINFISGLEFRNILGWLRRHLFA